MSDRVPKVQSAVYPVLNLSGKRTEWITGDVLRQYISLYPFFLLDSVTVMDKKRMVWTLTGGMEVDA